VLHSFHMLIEGLKVLKRRDASWLLFDHVQLKVEGLTVKGKASQVVGSDVEIDSLLL
jgi:hypothetical protein